MIKGKAKLSSIFRICIIVAAICMLGYSRAFLGESISSAYYKIAISLLGIILAFWSYSKQSGNVELASCYRLITKYMKVYILIIAFTSIYSAFLYNYSLSGLFTEVFPYLYAFWAYPICYVLFKDGSSEKTLKIILVLVVGILIIKFVGWFLFEFGGIKVFEDLIFQYSEWSRAKTQRVDIGYLFAFAYTFALFGMYRKKVKVKYIAIVTGMILFALIVTQYRFLVITTLLEFLVVYYFASTNSKNRIIRVLIIACLFAAFIFLGGFDIVLDTFSTKGEYATSTLARFNTITHYWELMVDKFRIFGLGFLSKSNPNTVGMIVYGNDSTYWMSDIGMLGGIFTFGILSIPIYGYLYYLIIKTCKKAHKYRNSNKLILLVGLSTYLIVLCIMMNIFDVQRAFNLPFYLAFFSFWNYKIDRDGYGSSRI